MKGARDYYMNIILTPAYDWAVSSRIYESQILSVCNGQAVILQEDSILLEYDAVSLGTHFLAV